MMIILYMSYHTLGMCEQQNGFRLKAIMPYIPVGGSDGL